MKRKKSVAKKKPEEGTVNKIVDGINPPGWWWNQQKQNRSQNPRRSQRRSG